MSAKRKKIVPSKPHLGQGFHCIEVVGGPKDGTVWRTYWVQFSDGTSGCFWRKDGDQPDRFYKQVFVPWDFEHPSIL